MTSDESDPRILHEYPSIGLAYSSSWNLFRGTLAHSQLTFKVADNLDFLENMVAWLSIPAKGTCLRGQREFGEDAWVQCLTVIWEGWERG